MSGGTSDLPGWTQQTEEKAEISYPVTKPFLEPKSFKCAWRVSFEQPVPLSPPFCFRNVLPAFITQENGEGVSMERVTCHVRKGKTKFPGVFAGLSSEAFCLHCMHHSPGSLEHSKEIPLLYLRQGKCGTVNTQSWKRLSVITRHTVIPTCFYQSLQDHCQAMKMKRTSWPDSPPFIKYGHYRKSKLMYFTSKFLFQILGNTATAWIWEHLHYCSARATKASTCTSLAGTFSPEAYILIKAKEGVSWNVCIEHQQWAHANQQCSGTLPQKQALPGFDCASVTDTKRKLNPTWFIFAWLSFLGVQCDKRKDCLVSRRADVECMVLTLDNSSHPFRKHLWQLSFRGSGFCNLIFEVTAVDVLFLCVLWAKEEVQKSFTNQNIKCLWHLSFNTWEILRSSSRNPPTCFSCCSQSNTDGGGLSFCLWVMQNKRNTYFFFSLGWHNRSK